MTTGNVWLETSLFCECKNWQRLLKKVDDFVTSVNGGFPFYLELNDFRGSNIRCGFLVLKKHRKVVAQSFDHEIKRHFKKMRMLPTDGTNIKNKEQVFMDFPRNTVYYGLFKLPGDVDPLLYTSSPVFKISQLLLEIFKNSRVDSTSLITTMFQMHLVLFKVFERCCGDLVPCLQECIYVPEGFEYIEKDEFYLALFESNKKNLSKTRSDVWDSAVNKLPEWLIYWEQYCGVYLTGIQGQATGLVDKCAEISSQIYRQFATDIVNEHIVRLFLFKIFSECFFSEASYGRKREENS